MAAPEPPLVLWRLRGHGRDVRCLRHRTGEGFELRVLWGQQLFLTETFHDEVRLLGRAEDFRQGLLSRGWQPLALDPRAPVEMGDPNDVVIGLQPGVDEAAYLAELDRLSPPDTGRRPTVLVVDDEPGVRRVLRSNLEKAGYAVCEAGNIEDALTALEQSAVDAVVLDVHMPDPTDLGRSGLEVLTYMRLHASMAAVPVIALTERTLDAAEEDLLKRNRADLFMKPDGYRLLPQRLDQLTGRRELARR
jgi:CheY-like chemotaxis protein